MIGSGNIQAMEKYSSGGRGAPAKGVGRSRGARVQIPLSPLNTKTRTEVIASVLVFLFLTVFFDR